jgi:hypothetical protein
VICAVNHVLVHIMCLSNLLIVPIYMFLIFIHCAINVCNCWRMYLRYVCPYVVYAGLADCLSKVILRSQLLHFFVRGGASADCPLLL